jgi:hypothetical protein
VIRKFEATQVITPTSKGCEQCAHLRERPLDGFELQVKENLLHRHLDYLA